MICRSILRYLIFTFLVSSLPGGLHIFGRTSLRCNSLQWNGAPERCPRGPAKRGSGSGGDARPRLWYMGRPHPATGSHLPVEDTAPALRGRAPERCPRGPAKRGSGSGGDARPRSMVRRGARISLQGRTFLRKALLRPAWSHSASLRLALHLKNYTLHPVQLPDLG